MILIWLKLVNLSEVLKTLSSIKLVYLSAFLVFFVLSGFLRATRLKLLLKRFSFPLKDLFFLNFLSQFLSFAIPIRAGEIAKGVYLSSNPKIPFTQGLLFSFLDRFIDFWVNILTLSLMFLFIPIGVPGKVRVFISVLLIGFSAATILILATQNLVKKIVPFWFAHSIIDGFDVFRRPPMELFELLALSVLAAVSDAMILYFILLSLGVNLGFIKTLISNLLFALTFLIPAAPGYVGNIEVGIVAILSGIMKLPVNLSSGAALVAHVLNLLIVPLVGLVSLYVLKFDLKLVWRKLQRGQI